MSTKEEGYKGLSLCDAVGLKGTCTPRSECPTCFCMTSRMLCLFLSVSCLLVTLQSSHSQSYVISCSFRRTFDERF
ncbi:hypothetical protein B296_00050940 [Ensete ventricosum]|uniref:Uncharacterized protein n=1 Tax=Ensete ventricosum TaxID=4639 RepID=A0A426YJ22_ENSVE|nr:hypothetical protein B296_00050940 [Ensete ventricosum]